MVSRRRSAAPCTAASRRATRSSRHVGMSGAPIINVEAGCASGGAGARARRRGDPLRPLRHRTGLRYGEDAEGHHPVVVLRAVARGGRAGGHTGLLRPASAAPDARVERDTAEQLAAGVGEEPSPTASHNPYAMFRKPFTLASGAGLRPMVCEPLTLYMLCSPNEGAAAVVLRRAQAATSPGQRASCAPPPCVHTCRAACLGEHTPMSGLLDDGLAIAERSWRHGPRTRKRASDPKQLQVVEVQDTDSAPRAAVV